MFRLPALLCALFAINAQLNPVTAKVIASTKCYKVITSTICHNTTATNPPTASNSCETGQYLLSSSGVVFDHFSTTRDYILGTGPYPKSSIRACMDLCVSLGTNCTAMVWVQAGQEQQNCYIKTSIAETATVPNLFTAYSAVKAGNMTACAKKGTDMLSAIKKCNTGGYLLSSSYAVFDHFSTSRAFSVSGAPVVKTSMTACLDYCVSLGAKCVAATWYQAGLAKQMCYPQVALTVSKAGFPAEVTAYSVVKDGRSAACPNMGTNLLSMLKTCETGQYAKATSGVVFDRVSRKARYAGGSGVVKTSLKACLDYCVSLGETRCVAVSWVKSGSSGKMCYVSSSMVTGESFASKVVGYSAVRNDRGVSCPGIGSLVSS